MSFSTTLGDSKTGAAKSRDHQFEILLVVCFAVASALAAVAEHLASVGDKSSHYVVFWIGYAFVLLPSAIYIVRRSTRAANLSALVFGLGIWGMVPKLLRSGHQILYFDEFDHFRILQDLFRGGVPIPQKGLLQIGATFPGLELFTSATAHLSSATLLNSALVVTVIVHVVTLLGLFTLVKELSKDPRAGAMAALIYTLNPSWLFFDSQFSYEGFGIAVLIWTLVLVNRSISVNRQIHAPRVSLLLAIVLSLSLVTIHHVTSIMLCVALVLLALLMSLRHRFMAKRPVESLRITWLITLVVVAATTLRLTSVGSVLFRYLAPSLQLSVIFKQFLGLLGLGPGAATRATLTGGLPIYEIICGYAMIPIMFAFFVWAVLGLLKVRSVQPTMLAAFAIFGFGYFASLSVVTVRQFSESVHRSWAYSFIGLAVVVSVAIIRQVDGDFSVVLRRRTLWPLKTVTSRRAAFVAFVSLAVITIGCVATGPTSEYRFASPIIPGEDAAAYGTQTSMVADWFAHNTNQHDVVFADRFVGHEIAIHSQDQFPIVTSLYGLTFDRGLSLYDLEQVKVTHVNFIVIDRRMSSVVPGNGFWYGYTEPHSYTKILLPEKNIERYGCLLWLNTTFTTSDYEVFRVNPVLLAQFIKAGNAGISTSCIARGIR